MLKMGRILILKFFIEHMSNTDVGPHKEKVVTNRERRVLLQDPVAAKLIQLVVVGQFK